LNPDGTVWVLHEPTAAWVIPGDDAVWISQHREDNGWDIERFLPESNRLDHVANVPSPQDNLFVFGMGVNGSLWLVGPHADAVTRYDLTGAELDVLPVGEGPIEPVLAFGDLWILNHEGNSVSRVDTATATVEATMELDPPGKPLWMTEGDGRLWFIAANSSIYEIDPDANEIVRVIDTGYDRLHSVTYFGGKLWARSADTSDTVAVDPATEEVSTAPQPFRTLTPLVAQNGWIWLPGASDGDYIDHLVAIDPDSLEQVGSFDLVEAMVGGSYGIGFDSIWISGDSGTLRIPEDALPTD
jgi:streptogramin lyase